MSNLLKTAKESAERRRTVGVAAPTPTAIAIVADAITVPLPIIPTAPCPTCGDPIFWLGPTGLWSCVTCRPAPPAPGMAVAMTRGLVDTRTGQASYPTAEDFEERTPQQPPRTRLQIGRQSGQEWGEGGYPKGWL